MPTSTEQRSRTPRRPRGFATRLKFQDILLEQLETKTWREITVTSVAKAAGTSTASLYCYYLNLDVLAAATAKRLTDTGQPVPAHLAQIIALLAFEHETGL